MQVRERYVLEHQVMPSWIYRKETRETFIKCLENGEIDFLWENIKGLYDKHKAELKYRKEDYKFTGYKLADNIVAVCITMPRPEESPDCERVYLVHKIDDNFDNVRYYTSEFDHSSNGSEVRFVCLWTEDQNHKVLAILPSDTQDIIRAELSTIYKDYKTE